MSKSWQVPCLRGALGTWVFYPALMTASQISEHVMTVKEIREAKALDDYLQRDLQPRVRKIVRYLITRDTRFFNSIIIGVFDALPKWIEFNLEAVAKERSIPNANDLAASLGILAFDGNETMFALDGQHRVAAIKEAFEKSRLSIKTDEYPVIFVAHVDDKEGKIRTRRLFSDINKNAVPVSGGDKVVIDEDDLCAIVTRRMYAEYPAFNEGDEIAVTGKKEQLTQDGKERFTSLLAIYTVCKCLSKLFHRARASAATAEVNVEAFKASVAHFFDFAFEHEPSLNRYFRRGDTTLYAERNNNRSLCFRPIGLEVLARLYVHFAAGNRLAILQRHLHDISFENPGGTFDGVLWNAGRIEASAKARNASVGLCLYLLDELEAEQELELLAVIRDLRKNQNYELPAKLRAR